MGEAVPYAFKEFHNLVLKADFSVPNKDSIIRYLCSLVAELTYYHVPEFEIDGDIKRAKLVPCEAYQQIIQRDRPTDVRVLLEGMDFQGSFVVVDRNIIVIAIRKDQFLFIGFRGTKSFYDWKINLRILLTRMNFYLPYHGIGCARVHCGFLEDAMRISLRIREELEEKNISEIEHIFLSGHSLGGAVAALSSILLLNPYGPLFWEPFHKKLTSILFGSPRYCNAAAYSSMPSAPPINIARLGDIVPRIPPRCLGYADHPYEFDTQEKQTIMPSNSASFPYFLWQLTLFFCKRKEPHSMENYRKELGLTAKKAIYSQKALVEWEKL